VGFLHTSEPNPIVVAAFRDGLGQAGYVEGRNVAIEFRWAQDDNSRLPESLPARRARQDRRASSHGSDRRATAVRLRVGGRQGCGLTTPLTQHNRPCDLNCQPIRFDRPKPFKHRGSPTAASKHECLRFYETDVCASRVAAISWRSATLGVPTSPSLLINFHHPFIASGTGEHYSDRQGRHPSRRRQNQPAEQARPRRNSGEAPRWS
jgi:hypothetical protein